MTRRRRCRGLLVPALALVLAATIAIRPAPLLVWNVSPSAPTGLYSVSALATPQRGDMVIARVPARHRMFAALRHYIPANVPLVKRVAAASGDRICAVGNGIFANGRRIAERRAQDGRGRPMPWWSGCVVLGNGALFLLMDDPASFDGRYFGPTGRHDIVGKAHLLWER